MPREKHVTVGRTKRHVNRVCRRGSLDLEFVVEAESACSPQAGSHALPLSAQGISAQELQQRLDREARPEPRTAFPNCTCLQADRLRALFQEPVLEALMQILVETIA